MQIRVDSVEARRLAVIAEGLRVSARTHKQSIRAHRDALRMVMQALAVCEEITNEGGAFQHGRSSTSNKHAS